MFQAADPGTFGEDRNVFEGRLRVVRNARRVRLLKRRGVEVDGPYVSPGKRYWVWFETYESAAARAYARKMKRALARHVRECIRRYGLAWVHHMLQGLRPYQRNMIEAIRLDHVPRPFVMPLGAGKAGFANIEARVLASNPKPLQGLELFGADIELDECARGFLSHNYFPIGEPVGDLQLMRCERCNSERQDDCR